MLNFFDNVVTSQVRPAWQYKHIVSDAALAVSALFFSHQLPYGVRSISPNVLANLVGIAAGNSGSASSTTLSKRIIDDAELVTERCSMG